MSSNLGEGEIIQIDEQNSRLIVPNKPIICFIEGDGIGPDIWNASQPVFDDAIKKSYKNERKIVWKEVLAGEKSYKETGDWLPKETIDDIKKYVVAIKGPLTTPIGGGIRSLNVSLRQFLDLYACVRPVKYIKGTPSPVKHPENMDIVLFRENIEDVYSGIEWESDSKEANEIIEYLNSKFGVNIREYSGIGIKPISPFGTKRLVRKSIKYAIENNRESVTLVHKGNIMKFTEGAFRDWGYELAREEFPDETITEDELWDKYEGKAPEGKIIIKDRIADNMLQQVLTRTNEYNVIASPNLNGDLLSDACAAQVGGLGMAPGANIGDYYALFEATHGTAPKYAGQDKVNPSSVILSGVMMFEYLGWQEAADLIVNAMEQTLKNRTVTYDLERQMDGATLLKSSEFGKAIISNMD